MSIDSHRHGVPVQRFQSLSLAIPLDPSQFDYIRQFIGNLLNISDPQTLLSSESKTIIKDPLEILPDIYLPNDLWLKDNITIKDIKIKTTMLTEINSMIGREISSDETDLLDETSLLYYQKILMAYKFYETPSTRTSFSNLNQDFSLREEMDEETDDYTQDESKLLNRTVSNQSSNSLKTHHSYFSNNGSANSTHSNNYNYNTLNNSGSGNGNTSRRSSHSKEPILSRKRFLSLVGGHNGNSNGNNTNGSVNTSLTNNNSNINYNNGHNGHNYNDINGVEMNEDDHKKQQALNSLLSKSKIYNKIKKNRELSSSMNSNISTPSLPYSARNSVSTTATASSSSLTKGKRSSSATTPDNSDLRHSSFVPVPQFASYSLAQRQEIQKNKYEYYIQVRQLLNLIDRIIRLLQLNPNDGKSFKLMDFIKRYVFKFIVLDASDMVISYGEIDGYRMYSRV